MIPQSYIDAWRSEAPWSSDLQVEQDLVLARAVAELFGDDRARELVAMRRVCSGQLSLRPSANSDVLWQIYGAWQGKNPAARPAHKLGGEALG